MTNTTTGFTITKIKLGNRKISSKKFYSFLISIIATINILALIVALYSLHDSYQEIINHTSQNAENLSLILEKNIDSILNKTDLLLNDISNEIITSNEEQLTSNHLTNFLNNQKKYLIDFDNIGILNKDKTIIY